MEATLIGDAVTPTLSLLFMAGGAFVLWTYLRHKRGALDVLDELHTPHIHETSSSGSDDSKLPALGSEQVAFGIFSKREWLALTKTAVIFPLIGAAVVLTIRVFVAPFDILGHIVLCGGGAAVGYIVQRRHLAKKKIKFKHQIDFYLPLVVERLAMAAQAGLDVLPAMKAVVQVPEYSDQSLAHIPAAKSEDPVTIAFRYVVQLSESGVPLERAFREVSERFESVPLRHALIHLAVAHEQGGALTAPLRELGDATQLYFQESIEEQIAKMPVKATMPLLLAFAGLILIFLSVPATQILEFLHRSKPV